MNETRPNDVLCETCCFSCMVASTTESVVVVSFLRALREALGMLSSRFTSVPFVMHCETRPLIDADVIFALQVIRKHIESTILHEISHVLPTSDEFAKEEEDDSTFL